MSFLDTVRVNTNVNTSNTNTSDAGTNAHTNTTNTTAQLTAVIDDDWGIVYSQGGVVFAAMLRAAEQTLDRPDLVPVSTNATFIRPVRCGPIAITVDVLRSGRNGAQTRITVHDPADEDPTPNVQATLVCATSDATFPTFDGLTTPFTTNVPGPENCPRLGTDHDDRPTMPFFRRTDWRDATPADSFLHKRLWFSFSDEPDSPVHGLGPTDAWDFALLPIPGDALGMAGGPSATEVVGPLTSPTLELSLQFASPARGQWIGVESQCNRSAGGLISGVASLWNTDGSLIATAVQTAMLRRLPTR